MFQSRTKCWTDHPTTTATQEPCLLAWLKTADTTFLHIVILSCVFHPRFCEKDLWGISVAPTVLHPAVFTSTSVSHLLNDFQQTLGSLSGLWYPAGLLHAGSGSNNNSNSKSKKVVIQTRESKRCASLSVRTQHVLERCCIIICSAYWDYCQWNKRCLMLPEWLLNVSAECCSKKEVLALLAWHQILTHSSCFMFSNFIFRLNLLCSQSFASF